MLQLSGLEFQVFAGLLKRLVVLVTLIAFMAPGALLSATPLHAHQTVVTAVTDNGCGHNEPCDTACKLFCQAGVCGVTVPVVVTPASQPVMYPATIRVQYWTRLNIASGFMPEPELAPPIAAV
jgi:hypothetical protein